MAAPRPNFPTFPTIREDLPNMSSFRYKAAGVSINDHQFLVTGGEDRRDVDGKKLPATMDTGPVLKSCEYFDINTNSWHNLPIDLPCPLMGHGLLFIGDKLFLFGGQSVATPADWIEERHTRHSHTPPNYIDVEHFSARSEVFVLQVPGGNLSNLRSGEHNWEPLPRMTFKRSNFAVVADGRYAYVIGGNNDAEYLSQRRKGYNPNLIQWSIGEKYDTLHNSWTLMPQIPRERVMGTGMREGAGRHCAAGLIENKIVVMCGVSNQSRDLITWVFDIQHRYWYGWHATGGLSHHCVLTHSNNLFTIGGINYFNSTPPRLALNSADLGTPWDRLPVTCKPRFGCVADILEKDGRKYVIVAGGTSNYRDSLVGPTAEKMCLEAMLHPPALIFDLLTTFYVHQSYWIGNNSRRREPRNEANRNVRPRLI